MNGFNLNLSTLKRVDRDIEDVVDQFRKDGWTKTGEAGPKNNVLYFQKTGVNLTVYDGPFGVTVFPSGPVRGAVFGGEVSILSGKSDLFEPITSSNGGDNPNVSSTQHT